MVDSCHRVDPLQDLACDFHRISGQFCGNQEQGINAKADEIADLIGAGPKADQHSHSGVAQDQDGARLMGINVNGTISFTFALGGALAGAAGVLYFLCQTQTYYDTGTQLGLIAFTSAVLGGIGNLTGAVVGGLAIGLIQAINEGGAYGLGSTWSQSVVFIILIILMVFKPEGLFGRPTTEKV